MSLRILQLKQRLPNLVIIFCKWKVVPIHIDNQIPRTNFDTGKITAGIERLSTLYRSVLWREVKRYTLSPLQAQILLFINSHAEALNNVSHLAKEFAVTKATISDAVHVLLGKKLLKRQSGNDKRAFSLLLTASGRKQARKLSTLTEFFDGALAGISAEDTQKIWEGLLLLIGNLQRTGVIPLRMCFGCQHFGRDHISGTPHYCKLMQKPLALMDIRLDCSEHSA